MKLVFLSKIINFRGEDAIVHETGDGCISILKATGVPCGKPVADGELKCRHHMKRGKVGGE
jgi:hypothetical protein